MMPLAQVFGQVLGTFIKTATISSKKRFSSTAKHTHRLSQHEMFMQGSHNLMGHKAVLEETLASLMLTRNALADDIEALTRSFGRCKFHSNTAEGMKYDEMMDTFDTISLQINQTKCRLNSFLGVKQAEAAMNLTQGEIACTHKHITASHARILERYLSSLSNCALTLHKDNDACPTKVSYLKQKMSEVRRQLALLKE